MNKLRKITTVFMGLATVLLPAAGVHGKPCLFSDYFAEWRCFPAILADAAGNLTCGGHLLNHGGVTAAPPAAGAVSATVIRTLAELGPQGHFVYRDGQGRILDVWFEREREHDRWHADVLNDGGRTAAPLAAGDPVGLVFAGRYHVVYRALGGALQDLGFDGDWRVEPVVLAEDGEPALAEGDPTQVLFQGVRHLLLVEPGGSLRDLWRDPDGWHWQRLNLGTLTSGPAAMGTAAGLEGPGGRDIVYRDRQGDLRLLHLANPEGAWQAERLSGPGNPGRPGALPVPRAAGDPSLGAQENGWPQVIYRDAEGAILELAYAGAGQPWRLRRLNLGGATQAPPAASDPVLMVPASEWRYVAYTDRQGEAQLLVRARDGAWKATRLGGAGDLGSIR